RIIKKKALYFTDKFNVYYETIPWSQHQPVSKQSDQTSYIESLTYLALPEVA
ncbi:hypothetical protein DB44_HH00020, partial [Candidatus Protochlamydia amoebophila]